MARDKAPFQSLTGMAGELAEHSMEKAQGAMKNYFAWLQSAMSAAPWGNTDLNKKLLDYSAEKYCRCLRVCTEADQSQELGRGE
jgi:hypothetical protein